MEALKRVIGVVLILIAAIVAIHTVIEPVYHSGDTNSSAWYWINLALCYLNNTGIDIRLHSHEPRRRRFERTRVCGCQHDILRIPVHSHTLLLELVRHQRRWARFYRCQCRYPRTGMDYLSRHTPVVERCNGCSPAAFQCQRITRL